MLKLLGTYRSKKYLQRTIASISLLVLLLLIVFSGTLYFRSEKIVLDMQKEANTKVLSQIKFNVSYLNNVLQKLAASLYYDNDVIPLMTSTDDSDFFEQFVQRARIDKFASYTPFIHSIMIYNANLDTFVWGGDPSVQDRNAPIYGKLRSMLGSGDPLPKLQMIPMSLSEDEGGKVDFFSMFHYESIRYEPGQSVVILNVNPQWLFDNIRLINQLAWEENENVFLMEKSGRVLSAADGTPGLDDGLTQAILKHTGGLRPEDDVGTFAYSLDGTKKIVSYLSAGINGWTLVSIQPYDALAKKTGALRNASIVVTAIFLIFSLFATLGVSHRLYRPLGKLVNTIRRDAGADADPNPPNGDELGYVSSVYRETIDRLQSASNEQITSRQIVRPYHIRQLLADGPAMSEEQFRAFIREHRLAIHHDGPYVLFVVKPDDCAPASRTEIDLKLLHFAISNIAQEIVSDDYDCEVVEMKNEHLAAIVSSHAGGREPDIDAVRRKIENVQSVVSRLYRITVSAALSEPAPDHSRLTDSYGRCLEYLRYQWVFGRQSIIDSTMIRANMENREEAALPSELEKKLIESMKSRQDELFERTLDRIMKHIGSLNHDYLIYMALHVFILMKNVIREMNENRLVPLSVQLADTNVQIMNSRSLDEVRTLLGNMYREMSETRASPDQERNDVLIDTIKAIVEQNYSDMNLSLQMIGDILKLSPDYIGKLFKKHQGMAVAEYINDVRLRQAVHYLEQGNYTINDLIEKIGIGNRGNFFRLFKNKYGTTPKEYRTKKSIGL